MSKGLSRVGPVFGSISGRGSSRHPLRSIGFHLAGILRELGPTRGGR